MTEEEKQDLIRRAKRSLIDKQGLNMNLDRYMSGFSNEEISKEIEAIQEQDKIKAAAVQKKIEEEKERIKRESEEARKKADAYYAQQEKYIAQGLIPKLDPKYIEQAKQMFPELKDQFGTKPVQPIKEDESVPVMLRSSIQEQPALESQVEEQVKQEEKPEDRFTKFNTYLDAYEGTGFTNLKGDKPTVNGITLDTYRARVNPNATIEDLKKITPEEILRIKKAYYDESGAGNINNDSISELMYNMYFNKGTRSLDYLKELVGIAKDGNDQEVYDKINSMTPEEQQKLFASSVKKELQGYYETAKNIPEKRKFLNGWINRLSDIAKRGGVDISQIAPEILTSTQELLKQQPTQEISKQQPVEKEKARSMASETVPQVSIEDLMKESESREQQARLSKSMAQFRDAMIGMGLGKKYESDMEMYDAAIKSANKPLQDLMLKAQLKDEQAKRDPSSPISKFVRSHLNSRGIDTAGLENVSYSQMEKIYPEFIKSMDKKLETEARKAEAEYKKATAEGDKIESIRRYEEGKNERLTKMQEAIKKDLVTRTNKVINPTDKSYEVYQKSIVAESSIDAALKSWADSNDKYKTDSSTAFMQFAQIAQNDSSVVRESDMKVLVGGINYGSLGFLINKFKSKVQGSRFTPQELQAFKGVVQRVREIKKRDMQKRLNPILKQAGEYGVSPDLLVDPSLLEDIYTTPLSPQERAAKIEARIKELEDKAKQ